MGPARVAATSYVWMLGVAVVVALGCAPDDGIVGRSSSKATEVDQPACDDGCALRAVYEEFAALGVDLVGWEQLSPVRQLAFLEPTAVALRYMDCVWDAPPSPPLTTVQYFVDSMGEDFGYIETVGATLLVSPPFIRDLMRGVAGCRRIPFGQGECRGWNDNSLGSVDQCLLTPGCVAEGPGGWSLECPGERSLPRVIVHEAMHPYLVKCRETSCALDTSFAEATAYPPEGQPISATLNAPTCYARSQNALTRPVAPPWEEDLAETISCLGLDACKGANGQSTVSAERRKWAQLYFPRLLDGECQALLRR